MINIKLLHYFALILIINCSLHCNCDEIDDLMQQYRDEWEAFKKEFNKVYKSKDEERSRFMNWLESKKLIEEYNKDKDKEKEKDDDKKEKKRVDDVEQLMKRFRDEWEMFKIRFKINYKSKDEEREAFLDWLKFKKKNDENNNNSECKEKEIAKVKELMRKYRDDWDAFKKKFGITYSTEEEERKRFLIWLKTKEMEDEINRVKELMRKHRDEWDAFKRRYGIEYKSEEEERMKFMTWLKSKDTNTDSKAKREEEEEEEGAESNEFMQMAYRSK